VGDGNDPGVGVDVGEFSSSCFCDGEGPDDGARDRLGVWEQGGVEVFSRESDEEGTCWGSKIMS
jgi:hypothetical protein